MNPKLNLGPKEFKDQKKLIKDGQVIHASSPWPKYLYGKDGSLPEYVVSTVGADGRMKWIPGTPGDEHKGFYNRARVDLELVIDGNVIDLNRIRFPKHVVIVDQR